MDRVSTIVAWSPNIMTMYFIPRPFPFGDRRDAVGADGTVSTSA